MKLKHLSLGVIALSAGLSAQAQITTSSFVSATSLANSLLGASSGITINSASYIGVNDASGFFTSTAGLLPFNSGIVLTTGSRSSVEGTNTAGDTNVENFASGDAALSALSGLSSYEAAVLEIRFTPTRSLLSFQYAFGSEEYNEWVGFDNDVFGLFLNGTNIAKLPGGSDAGISTINQGANSAYYYDNELGLLPTQLDGFGGINPGYYLFASGTVNVGVQNVLRIAIGDAGDFLQGTLDSALFIAGGSLITTTPVPEPSTYALCGSFVLLGMIWLRRRALAARKV
jgi:hypothetical protein